MKIRTVAFRRFPDGSFVTTCRDVTNCGAWREDDRHLWLYNKPEIKWTIIFKGPAKEAEMVRRTTEAGLLATGQQQKTFTDVYGE